MIDAINIFLFLLKKKKMLENKLLSFRNQQKKEEKETVKENSNRIKSYFKSIYNSFTQTSSSSCLKTDIKKEQDVKIIKTKSDLKREKFEQLQKLLKETTQATDAATSLVDNEDDDDKEVYDKHFKINLILKFVLWLILFIIFIKLEFGLVYFIISLIVAIYLNTSKTKKKGVLSAYSVFNPNLERLNGTFTSDHVEKSIRNTI